MDSLRILGAHGGRSAGGFATTCLQPSPHVVIDAGNILTALGDDAVHIDHIFFTHSHLDHLLDSAFIIDNFFDRRTKPLRLHGLPETLEAVKKHLFNWDIWPDFSSLKLTLNDTRAVDFVPVTPFVPIQVDGLTLTPIPAHHTVPCCGYEIRKDKAAVLFTSDTSDHPGLWHYLNTTPDVTAVIVDVSFPNRLQPLADASRHFTPQGLKAATCALNRDALPIYIAHLKPSYAAEITRELQSLGFIHILHGGEDISYATGNLLTPQPTGKSHVDTLNRIGTALSAQNDLDALLEMIITEAKKMSGADGGTLYLRRDNYLHFQVAQTDSLGIRMGGLGDPISWPPLPLYLDDGAPNRSLVAATCALDDVLINIPDVYTAAGFNFDGTRKFDASTGYRSRSMLVIPLKNHEQDIIGVLQLLNKQQKGHSIAFTSEDEQLCLSLASQAAVAITNATLIHDLETLLEAFLKSIIFTIEKKSPYTAGHIKRMVDMTMMLASAIHKDRTTFNDRTFAHEDFKQLKFAALMHDIGKLATPEHVVDKATKLHGLHDGIELVQARLQNIRQSCEIACLKKEISDAEKEDHLAHLQELGDLIEQTNRGSEFLPDEKAETIARLATEPYRIGSRSFYLLTPDEAHRLSVRKGTLTSEERAIINDHAKITVDILNALPFPKKYRDIPQISGNHHEKINGKGYPQGLAGDAISFEARILAVADIFEALTAADRPYKEPNPLSSAMKILYFMARDDEIDRDIVKFFYNSGLYKEYARRFLPDHLIDRVTTDFSSL